MREHRRIKNHLVALIVAAAMVMSLFPAVAKPQVVKAESVKTITSDNNNTDDLSGDDSGDDSSNDDSSEDEGSSSGNDSTDSSGTSGEDSSDSSGTSGEDSSDSSDTSGEDSSDSSDTSGGFSVTIENPKGSHITIAAEKGKNLSSQTNVKGAMQEVYYYADDGYYFPLSYKVDSANGVRVVKSGTQKLTVKGTPTANTVITLKEAEVVNTSTYAVSVVNGTGSGTYAAGTSVDITASDKSGQTFTGWKVNKGDVTLVNPKSKTTSFVMQTKAVEVEACYSSGASEDGGSSGGGTTTEQPVVTVVVDTDTSTNNNSTTAGSSSTVRTTVTERLNSDYSRTLDLSAAVKWKSGKWKLTWDRVTSASGYDVFVGEGINVPTSDSYVSLAGNGSVSALITTYNSAAIDSTKIYSFIIKAYRVVNNTKEYIGTTRVLSAAGPNNVSYTNVKKLKPSKKTVSIKKGKKKKLQTLYKKQKSGKALLTNISGRKLSYFSSDTSVATVNASGKVKGVKKGECNIYIIAHNGVQTKVKIIVK